MGDSSRIPHAEPLFVAELQRELPGLAVEWLDSVDSTSSELRRRLEAGWYMPPTLLTTGQQTAGRGTRGREWLQPGDQPGLDLAMTLALPFPPQWEAEPRLSLLLGAASAAALQEACGLRIGVKWPNDLLLPQGGGWRKCGGLLLETLPASGQRWLLCGVGINVNSSRQQYPPRLREKAATICDALGFFANYAEVHRQVALALWQLLSQDNASRCDELLQDWQARDQSRGTRYVLLRDSRRIPVTTEGVDAATSGLRVRLPGGAVELVQSYTELEAG